MIYGNKFDFIKYSDDFSKINFDNHPNNLIIIPFNFRYEYRRGFAEITSEFYHVTSELCIFFSTMKRLIFTYIPGNYIQKAPKGLEHLQLKAGMHLLTANEWNTYPIGKKFDVKWHTKFKANHSNEQFYFHYRLVYFIKLLLKYEEIEINPQEKVPITYKNKPDFIFVKTLINLYEYILSSDSPLFHLEDFIVNAFVFSFTKGASLGADIQLGNTILAKLEEGYSLKQIDSMVELLGE